MDKINETKEELFDSRLVFTRALGAIIPDGEGIFLELDDIDLMWGIKKIIVHNTDGVIGIMNAEERTDLKNGNWVVMINEDTIEN